MPDLLAARQPNRLASIVGLQESRDDRTALAELTRLCAEIDALRATRTFRWTRWPREAYRRMRNVGAARRRRRAEIGTTDAPTSLFATPRVVTDVADCDFYHSIDLPEYGSVDGQWDLRPGIEQYLGGVKLSGKRVLEIGPASGYVTMEMERRGARVVSIELPDSTAVFNAYFPVTGIDLTNATTHLELEDRLRRLHNSFWLVHRKFQLSAQIYYGHMSALPEALGDFDLTFLGCVLLHCPNPLGMVLSCAERTRETIVITDVRSISTDAPDRQGHPVCVLYPSAENREVHTWWRFSPEFFSQALRALGFGDVTVTFHDQLHAAAGATQPLFTVVGSR
jgi:hypothetical protein